MKLIYISNAILTALIGTLLFVFLEINSVAIALNIVFLLLTLEMPTFYLLVANRKSLDKNDNELLVPSALVVGFAFIVNLIFYSVCIGVATASWKLFVLYTTIFHSVIAAILLCVISLTNYIRQQHK